MEHISLIDYNYNILKFNRAVNKALTDILMNQEVAYISNSNFRTFTTSCKVGFVMGDSLEAYMTLYRADIPAKRIVANIKIFTMIDAPNQIVEFKEKAVLDKLRALKEDLYQAKEDLKDYKQKHTVKK